MDFIGFRKIFFRGVREVAEAFSCASKLFKMFKGVSCSFREVLGACRASDSFKLLKCIQAFLRV